jgi:hypothetical protein
MTLCKFDGVTSRLEWIEEVLRINLTALGAGDHGVLFDVSQQRDRDSRSSVRGSWNVVPQGGRGLKWQCVYTVEALPMVRTVKPGMLHLKTTS